MVILTNDQKVALSVVGKTATNKIAPLDGQPMWTSSDPNIISLVVAPDGMSAEAHSVNLGTATVTVIADADMTAAVRQISASIQLQVTAAEAVSLELTAGIPVNK